MKIALFGGVFDSAMADYALSAPEVVLRRFLRKAGHEVEGVGNSTLPFDVSADIFHAHHFSPAAYALALGGQRPFVFTSHNPFFVSDYENDASRLDFFLQGRVVKEADAVVALSHIEAERLAATFAVPHDRFVVIPNGLDLELYLPGEERPRATRLLSVGQLAAYKGQVFLLDALAALAPRYPELHLTIVSHVRDPQSDVVQRCDELGLRDRVAFEGPLATPELVERYRSCDVYVQPSLAECFPVTVLEAMACGRPVVATTVGGVAEEVGDAGELVPPGDAAALASALARLLENDDLRRDRGRAARRRVEDRYRGEHVAGRHAELYASLGTRHHRPGRARRAAAAGALALYGRRGRLGHFVPRAVRRRAR